MRNQNGLTLVELVVVVAIASLALGMTIVFSTPWIARESMRGCASEMYSFMQLAKIEAVSRNRDCLFVVDTETKTLEVWDTKQVDGGTDDERLYTRSMPSAVSFARPDFGDVVTLDQMSGTERYQAVFTPDGMVSLGVGAVFIHGGAGYETIEAHAAGGVEIRRWNGNAWQTGY